MGVGSVTRWLDYLIHKGQCVCVFVCICLFSVEIQTAGQIAMKFGLEVVLKGGKVLGGGGVDPVLPTPRVWGAKRGSGGPLEPQPCVLVKTL